MQNLNHLVSLLQEGYTTCKVVFGGSYPTRGEDDAPLRNAEMHASSQQYTYKAHCELMPGDLVVVPANSHRKAPSIATVVSVDIEPDLNFESNIEYKWIIAKVDTRAYENILDREQELVKMLRNQQRLEQRRKLMESYQLTLPQDADQRKLFDQARQIGVTK